MTEQRSTMIREAHQLMLSKGFPATRVDEICAAAKVTKGSFYHHFKSKDALALVMIDEYFETITAKLCCDLPSDSSPTEQLFAFLDNAITVAKSPILRDGCLLGSLALDLSETHPEIREKLGQRFGELAKVVEALLKKPLRDRGLPKAVSAAQLANQFLAVLEGGIVLAKAAGEPQRLAKSLTCYRETVRLLLAT